MARVYLIQNSIILLCMFLVCQLAVAQQADQCASARRQAEVRRARVQSAIVIRVRQSGQRMRAHLQRIQQSLSPELRTRIIQHENQRRRAMRALGQQEGMILRQIQRRPNPTLPAGMYTVLGRASNGSDVICDEIPLADLGVRISKISACFDFVLQNFVTRPLSEPSFFFLPTTRTGMPALRGRFYAETPIEPHSTEPYMTSVQNLALRLVPVPRCSPQTTRPSEPEQHPDPATATPAE